MGLHGGGQRFYLLNAVALGCAFFFEYTALGGIQNLETSLLPSSKMGAVALGVLYLVFTLSCLFGPVMVDRMGARCGFSCTLGFV